MRRGLILFCVMAMIALLAAPAWAGLAKGELDNETLAVNFQREVARGDYQVVTTAELKKWMDEGKAMLIIDTMPLEDSFVKNHIPGAVQFLFPVPEQTEMSAEQEAQFKKLLGDDLQKTLVFYCGFTKCTRSHNGAMWARKLGYQNVYRCPGGIVGWTQQDYPVEKGK